MDMTVWKSQSNAGKQLLLACACAAVGLVLMIGFRGFAAINSNEGAGFLLGALLLLIGVPGLILTGRQTVLVDPRARRITVEDSNRFRTTTRHIPFGDIEGVSIGFLGKKSNFVSYYYLVLKLRSGGEYSLFAPGRFFEGASNRATVAGWKRRLETYLGG